jgi:phosphatidylserine decarboxylase
MSDLPVPTPVNEADDRIPSASAGDHLFAALQYVLPKHLLSRLIYSAARCETPWIKRAIIGSFLRGYQVDMDEAAVRDPYAYRSFNDFFTRALRPDARTLDMDERTVVSPVDGRVSQAGTLRNELLIQAKGHHYSLSDLLAGESDAIEAYRDGSFACLYLAPFNYHRIHMPLPGRLRGSWYVPGELFSVNAATVRAVSGVFARNERLVCDFDTPLGRMAMILVGALFVGSIETVYCGEVNPPPRGGRTRQPIAEGVGREFAKGEELGRFNMGSTVVMLFERDRLTWDASVLPDVPVRMGRAIARAKP